MPLHALVMPFLLKFPVFWQKFIPFQALLLCKFASSLSYAPGNCMFGVSWYDIVINLSYLMFLVGFALKDILWLRIVIIIAASVDIVGRMWLAPEPLYSDVIWCAFDVVVNGYQLAMILKERRGLLFTEKEKQLHAMAFPQVPWLQFKRLLSIAVWKQVDAQTLLTQQNSDVPSLLLIFQGSAVVEIDGAVVNHIANGNFVGEMSFLSGKPATADVRADAHTELILWDKSQLIDLMKKDEILRLALHTVFSGDLMRKLAKSNTIPEAVS